MNGGKMSLDPKLKDVLVKHILYLEECMFITFTGSLLEACNLGILNILCVLYEF
jgi:hypothetical protein